MHDLHATILQSWGWTASASFIRYTGRDFRLTDVYERVVKEILD